MTFRHSLTQSWVKDSIGSIRGEPTIISPTSYKARFCDIIPKYFLWVPDKWWPWQVAVADR
jgi:hypothetical protein